MDNRTIAVDVTNLNKSFDGKPAVVDASIKIYEGEIFGFLGPNGSGKTTTIRMLCGLLNADSGAGHCLGLDVMTEAQKIKQYAGYMTQKFGWYEDLTIEENLDFVARLYNMPHRKELVQHSLEDLGLIDRKKQLTGTLSGGWKQRLALAAALLHRPKLLLLDEPTAGVDPKARREFWNHIQALSEQKITTLVSTHYMDEAARCHRLAYIARGKILTHGTADTIIQASGLHTWHVSGRDLLRLNTLLTSLPGVEQVAAFGTALHISSHDSAQLDKSLQRFMDDKNWQWKKINPSLEDVFIALVSKLDELAS